MLKENILARRWRVCGFSSLFADSALEIGHLGIFLLKKKKKKDSKSSSSSLGTDLG